MNPIIEEGLKTLPIEGLQEVIRDCEARMQSHGTGEYANGSYLEKQRAIIQAAQQELNKRNQ